MPSTCFAAFTTSEMLKVFLVRARIRMRVRVRVRG